MEKQKIKGVTSRKQNGSKYWYARIDGKNTYCGEGDKGYQIAVAAKAKEITRKYEDKEVGAGLKVKRANFKNFAALLNWYMEQPSVQEKRGYVRKTYGAVHLIGFFGKKRINQIEGSEQEKYRVFRKGQGAAEATINLEISVLSAVYHLALKDKKIRFEDKPGRFVYKENYNPRRIVTDAEYKNLLKHADPQIKDVIICGYESAMRSGEICGLTAGKVHLDVDYILDGEVVKVDYIDLGIFDTKNKTRRTVPVSEKLKAVLKRRMAGLKPGDLVFTLDGQKWDKNHIQYNLKAACEKAKIEYGDKILNSKGERLGIVFHCFRHTRITKWVEAGFSDEIIRRATGHLDLSAYRKYIKLNPAAVMRLVQGGLHKNATKTAQTG